MNENNEKKVMKNQAIKIGILVVAIVVLGVSLSYAYYSANKSGNSQIDETTAGRLDLSSTLTTASAINNAKLQLLDASNVAAEAEKVEFSVTSADTSTVNGKYYIYLTDIQLSKNLYSKYFKWQLVRITSNGESEIANGNFENATRSDTPSEIEEEKAVTSVEDITLNSTVLTIAPNTTDQLLFRLWLENDPDNNQIELTEGTFRGKLKIEATPSH